MTPGRRDGTDVVVAVLDGGAQDDLLLRRAARLTAPGSGGELHAVLVDGRHGTPDAEGSRARLGTLADELGGRLHVVTATDPARGVLDLADGVGATQLVLGRAPRSGWGRLGRPDLADVLLDRAGHRDVVVLTRPGRPRRPARRRAAPLGRRRLLVGWVLAAGGPVVLSLTLLPDRDAATLALETMAFLALTVLCALVGGLWPAVTAAVLGSLLLTWFFTAPAQTLRVADPVNLASLLLFLLVAVAVASVVDTSARRSLQAQEARREAATLSLLNRTLLESDHDVRAVLELLRSTFGVVSAALLRRDAEGGWVAVGEVGPAPPASPDAAVTSADVAPSLVLALAAPALEPHDRRVLSSFATHLAVVLHREELARRAEAASVLEQGVRVRTALLAAVSHDLRTPLAGVKAAVSSLRSPDVDWSEEDRAELLRTIEESSDRLHTILANLLDLSRLQADAVRPDLDHIGLDDVVSRTVASLPDGASVRLRFAPDLPPVLADAGLLDRVVANLVENALRHAPPGSEVLLTTGRAGDRVHLHVVDHGPGIADADKEVVFEAFRRLGDTRRREGLGLGLAVARGLTEALGGRLSAEDTPGGGLTMVVDLPAAPPVDAPPDLEVDRWR